MRKRPVDALVPKGRGRSLAAFISRARAIALDAVTALQEPARPSSAPWNPTSRP